MTGGPTPKPGLQIERTHLAWERTAIGYLAIAAIILFHHSGPLGGFRVLLAILAILLALLPFGISRVRGRMVVRTAAPAVRDLSRAVRLAGWSTALLAVSLLAALVLSR